MWSWDSGAFGKEAPTGSATVNLRFPGQYYDSETGLHYNWHRYYDPTTGRYITSDPLGLIAGLNTYGYAAQNPLSFYDPDGQILPIILIGLHSAAWWLTGIAISQTIANIVDWRQGDMPWQELLCHAAWDWGLPFALGKMAKYLPRAAQWAKNFGRRYGDDIGRGFREFIENERGAIDLGPPIKKSRGVNNPKTKEALDAGNKAHKVFEEAVKAKADKGWLSKLRLVDPKTGKTVEPDAISPSGRPVELKPNTPSGRQKGKSQLPGYERATGKKGRVTYYNPEDYME